jgi:hypothetical protein
MEAVLGGDALDAVRGVEVLDDDHLEAGGAALAGGDGGPGKEELPDLGLLVKVRQGVRGKEEKKKTWKKKRKKQEK